MEIEAIKSVVLSWPDRARAMSIVDQETYDRSAEMLLSIKDLRKEINASFDPIIKKQFDAHREAVAQKKKVEEPLIEAEGIIKRSIGDFQAAQERIRQEAERKAREAAEKLEAELRLQQAVMAEEMGADEEQVEEVLQTSIPLPPPIIAPTFNKASGISARKVWKYRIVDATKIPREYMIPNEPLIGSIVRNSKGMNLIPGIEVYEETSIAAGRR